jgi:hypothetical protein
MLHVLTDLIDAHLIADSLTHIGLMTHHSVLMADLDFAVQSLITSLSDSINEIDIMSFAASAFILLNHFAVGIEYHLNAIAK